MQMWHYIFFSFFHCITEHFPGI